VKNNNQTTAKMRTTATSNVGNVVVCFGVEKQQPKKSSKPQTWKCSLQIKTPQVEVVHTVSC